MQAGRPPLTSGWFLSPPSPPKASLRLTIKAVHPGELTNLLLRPVVQDVHSEVRVVQGSDVLPGVIEDVGGLAAHRQKNVDRRVVMVVPRLAYPGGVVLRVEVFPPHGHPEV